MKWDRLKAYIEENLEQSKPFEQMTEIEKGFIHGLEDILNEMNDLTAEEETHTHPKYWIPEEDKDNADYRVTVGKEYKVIWDSRDKEEVIINDDGSMSLAFMTHNGRYIEKNE